MNKQEAKIKAQERYNSDDVPNAEHPQQGDWFKCVCPSCGWFGLSRDAAGGEPTGGDDYDDVRCPKCDGELHDPKTRDIVIARAAYAEGMESAEQFLYGDEPMRKWERVDGLQLKLYPEYNHDGGFYFSWLENGERWTNKLGPGDIMEALKEQGRTTAFSTQEEAKKEAQERYPISMAQRDLPDSYEGVDYEQYDINKESRDAFIMGRIAGPLVEIEALLKRAEDAERERDCCHRIWDQCFEIMGYGLSKGKPMFTDAVKKMVDRARWIPVEDGLPDLEETIAEHYIEGQKNWTSKTVLVRRPYNEMSPHSMITLSEYRVFGNGRKLWTNGSQDVEAWMEIPQQI